MDLSIWQRHRSGTLGVHAALATYRHCGLGGLDLAHVHRLA